MFDFKQVMVMKKVKIAGSFLLAVCSVAAQGVEFRTTTFAERWRDASASVESAKAADADLSLDLAATDAIGGAAWKVPLPADSVSTLVLPPDRR